MAKVSRLRQHAMDDTFADVEKLVYHTVHRFVQRKGGTFEDWIGEAHEAFMLAYERYKPERGPFPSFVRWVVEKRLLEVLRTNMRRKGKVVFGDVDPDLHPGPERGFILADFLDELSEDAQTVVKLALDTPHGLARCIEQKGGQPWNVRSVLREYLMAMEWSAERVTETFLEIRRAL
jgi:DNA-directed RNA polymerase specialized sigma24 family protein